MSFALLGLLAVAGAQEVPANVKEALKRADEAATAIVRIPDGQRTFENTIGALDDMSVRLDNDTSLTLFMQYVSTDPAERDASRAAEQAFAEFSIALGKREDLYRAVKAYAATNPKLEGEQKRLLEFTLRDYRRAGMDLPKEKRDRLAAIETELSKLAIEFQKNIYEDETVVFLTKEELRGVPDDVVKGLKNTRGLYLVGMDGPTFDAISTYAHDEKARQKVWTAYKRKGGKANVGLLEKMIQLRAEQAQLLGYATFADYVVETRMAKNAATVAKFYEDVRPVVRKKALEDWKLFTAAKKSKEISPWDYSYLKNKLQNGKYNFDSQKVAEYFPMESVVDGIFSITGKLYGIQYEDVTSKAKDLNLPIWHSDVKLFAVRDNASGETLGHLYLDLYPREAKYNHAACWGLRPRKVWADGTVQKPLAALVCNFTKPTADKPSLLPHSEVETFFHEFGHGLHNLLTEASYGRFSGAAVSRDFVEAPSQMFENWVWDADVLSTFAKHYKTGQPLPKKLLDSMVSARTLGSGLETEHQIYYGMVDQRYHTAKDGVVDTTKLGVDMLGEIELYKGVPQTWFQSAFGHLVGYEAAYYGYQWSLVYAADMFGRFKEKGLLSPEAGMEYRRKVLARGGTIDDMEMLTGFLGRAPKMDAYLELLGIK